MVKNLFIFLAAGLLVFQGPGAQAAEVLCSLHDGQAADGTTVLEKQGKKYEFCCSGCLQKFKESPEYFSTVEKTNAMPGQAKAEAACSTVCSD